MCESEYVDFRVTAFRFFDFSLPPLLRAHCRLDLRTRTKIPVPTCFSFVVVAGSGSPSSSAPASSSSASIAPELLDEGCWFKALLFDTLCALPPAALAARFVPILHSAVLQVRNASGWCG